MTIIFKKLTPPDHEQITGLLRANSLPFEDVDPGVQHLIGGFTNDQLMGIAGLEMYPPYALLRSVAIITSAQHHGYGSAMVKEMIRQAKALNLSKLYLLTETAEHFFHKHSFVTTSRTEVPGALQQSSEFQHICPVSAVCMSLDLTTL